MINLTIQKFKNEGSKDRLVRLFLAVLVMLGAYFWLGGVWQSAFYGIGIVILITSITGFCGLYKILGIKTCSSEPKPLTSFAKIMWIILALVIVIAGSYYSAFFTKKFFLADYNQMNNYYKQTLFYTGQDMRAEAVANYDQLVMEYTTFFKKYSAYQPYAIKSDTQFVSDIEKVFDIINSQKNAVYTGDLKQAHLDFEQIRPVFQDILKRNNFSMLAVTLVDFHDAMEKIIAAADAKDTTQLLAVYPEVDAKLKAIEEVANDAEIQLIRLKLTEINTLAINGQGDSLPQKAVELKSAFVKVYLKRG